jgi:hypothetical protein
MMNVAKKPYFCRSERIGRNMDMKNKKEHGWAKVMVATMDFDDVLHVLDTWQKNIMWKSSSLHVFHGDLLQQPCFFYTQQCPQTKRKMSVGRKKR